MIKKIKHALGIESVKIEVSLPEVVYKADAIIPVTIVYTTQSIAEIQSINIKFIEKYQRGRKDKKLINEYVVGKLDFTEDILISPEEPISKTYLLNFSIVDSEMDKLSDNNFVFKGLVKMAKFFKSVKSEYRIDAEAKVKGTKLNPIDHKFVNLK